VVLFDAYAESYDAWFTTPKGRVVWEIEERLLLEFLGPRPGEEILDAGCGTGLFTAALAMRGVRVTGVDVSLAMLTIARKRCRGFSSVVLTRADIAALPVPAESFDAVVCFTVLEFIYHPQEALREMWRVVRPGGRLVVGVLNLLSPWAWARRGRGVFAHARFYSYWDMRTLLRGALGPAIAFRWTGAVYFPPWTPQWCLSYVRRFEKLGAIFARPFGAVLLFRVDKKS